MSIRIRAYLAALVGLAIIIGLLVWIGFDRVLGSLEKTGWQGFVMLCLVSLGTAVTIGAAWRVLAPPGERGAKILVFSWGRLVRDGASDLLPFSQIAGFVVGARAVILRGVNESFAYASTVVDMTAELLAQIVFTVMGLAILLMHNSGLKLDDPVVAGPLVAVGLGIAAAIGFVIFQIRGGPLIEKLITRFLPNAQQRADAVNQNIQRLYENHWRLAMSSALHLLGWLMSAFQIWVLLRFMGSDTDYIYCIAIEALVYAAKSVAFMMPIGAGVQELSYAIFGNLFGLPTETGVALSLLKRGRDVVLGGTSLLSWQWVEGHRLFRKAKREGKAAEGS